MHKNGKPVEDLGYFYDTIHGRVAFGDLPKEFQSALRVALTSPALDRLTRISQLGHTSLTYFSATQTRFSHAVGTLLMMNRLLAHLWPDGSVPPTIIKDVKKKYNNVFDLCRDKSVCIRCHLLLASLYQDCGELPFQKVTSLYFRPHKNDLNSLKASLSGREPQNWKTKDVFTLRAISDLLKLSELKAYDFGFLAFLITGDDPECPASLKSLRQMMDGTIDADRLDYVYRDALLTIGSLSSADTVLRSILRYEPDHVVVSDPRPAIDFLATRARLWTFVYSSPDVRFRQTLLKSFLQAGFATKEARKVFRAGGFISELTFDAFVELDDHSMMHRMREIRSHAAGRIARTGLNACDALLKTVTDYECRIFRKKGMGDDFSPDKAALVPDDVFFDLLLDHEEEHKLYVPQSVRVEQALTTDPAEKTALMALEECSGSLIPVFSADNRAPLVRDSFFLFRPRRSGGIQRVVGELINSDFLFESLAYEDARREIEVLDDTWAEPHDFSGKKVAISCSFQDRVTIIRVVRALQSRKQRYRILLDSLIGIGNTAPENSEQLIREAEGILVIGSKTYIKSATTDRGGNIALEVREIYSRNTGSTLCPIVVLAIDPHRDLEAIPGWSWANLYPGKVLPPILEPLRNSSDTTLMKAVDAAIDFWNTK